MECSGGFGLSGSGGKCGNRLVMAGPLGVFGDRSQEERRNAARGHVGPHVSSLEDNEDKDGLPPAGPAKCRNLQTGLERP